jgi:hypothetical protein
MPCLANRIAGPTPRVDKFACKNCGFVHTPLPRVWMFKADNFTASRVTGSLSARSRARPTMSSAASVARVSCFRRVLVNVANAFQCATSLAIALRVAAALAATVTKRATFPKTARSRATLPRSSAVTVMSSATSARIAPSPATVSYAALVWMTLANHLQFLVSSAATARR